MSILIRFCILLLMVSGCAPNKGDNYKKDVVDIERLGSVETMRALMHINLTCSGYEKRARRLIDEGKITQIDDLTISKEVKSLKSICPYYTDILKKVDVRDDVERFLQFELCLRKPFKQKPNFKKSKSVNS